MPSYSVEGKLGTGKGKFCVFRAQQALREGRRVAANFELRLQHLVPELDASYTRLPHKPQAFDLAAIGHGNPDSYDEEKNGCLFLDECATWLNARAFQDKSRAGVLDWCVHARKHGWDVYFVVQNADAIDKQIRTSMIELACRCARLDKVRIPFIGGMLGSIFGGRAGYFPRMHMVTARNMDFPTVVAERWFFKGDDLHQSYDTREVFTETDPFGVHSVLPLVRVRAVIRWKRWLRAVVDWFKPRPAAVLKPKFASVLALASLSPDEAWKAAAFLVANVAQKEPSCDKRQLLLTGS